MAARKLQQEIDKCFKKVAEGVATFESIYEKIMQTGNPSQKEKLEDQLKKPKEKSCKKRRRKATRPPTFKEETKSERRRERTNGGSLVTGVYRIYTPPVAS